MGVAMEVGVGIAKADVGVAEKLTTGICDSLKKRADSTLFSVSMSRVGVSFADILLGTLGSGVETIALYIVKPIHIRTVIKVRIRIVIRLGNFDFCIILLA